MSVKSLHFSYDMHIEYTTEVSKCNFTIKCMPQDSCRQKIRNVVISMSPETPYSTNIDGLSNVQIYGSCEIPHKYFDYHIEGDATTGLCAYEEPADDDISMIFAHPHGLNLPGEKIKDFYSQLQIPDYASDYDRAAFIMNALHKAFSYEPFVTDIHTSAEEAFLLGKGVCQDYAHIFISLLHLSGIPARYITGLLIGEGQSHAWVELLVNGKWVGLDPTNNSKIDDNHIKISIGRDAGDCTINRGIVRGGGLHTQAITVVVSEK